MFRKRNILREELGRMEKIEAATDGEQALQRLREERDLPSLILLDLKMPGMNGFDILREIRSDGRLKQLPVIVVTSSSLEDDRQLACEVGADGFLYKEIDITRFVASLDAELRRFLNG